MNKEIAVGLVLTAAIAGGAVYWYYGRGPAPQPKASRSASAPLPAPVDEPVRYPVPATPDQPPLPALAESDGPFRAALALIYGEASVESFLAPKNLIARLVATLDSLDREPVPLRTRVIKPVPKLLVVETRNDTIFLSARNGERYQPLLAALQTVDGKTVAELYLHYYPLFQQAYVELGFPKGYFNDRLIKLIDHLLATPEPKGPVALVRPKVLYQFADPELERRSSGQKMLLRLGTRNAAVIKAKLREIRSVVAAAPAAGSD